MTRPSCVSSFQRVMPPPLIIGDRVWGMTLTKGEAMRWHLRQAKKASSPDLENHYREQAQSNYEWGGKDEALPGLSRRVSLFLLRFN